MSSNKSQSCWTLFWSLLTCSEWMFLSAVVCFTLKTNQSQIQTTNSTNCLNKTTQSDSLEYRTSVWCYLPFEAVVALLTINSVLRLSQCLLRVSHSLLLSSEILTSYLPWNSDGAFSCAIPISVFEITVCEKFCLSLKFTQYQNSNIRYMIYVYLIHNCWY